MHRRLAGKLIAVALVAAMPARATLVADDNFLPVMATEFVELRIEE